MPGENEGTPTTEGQAPAAGAAETPAATTDTAPSAAEVTTLRSRNAGLDAKVTELTKAERAADKRAADAEAKLAAYEAKTVGADEALRAQLQAAANETQAARREAALARVEAKYPETFGLFGEDAATFSEDKLAASEARLKGVPASDEPPTPRGSNGPRTTGSRAAPKEQTSADILAQLDGMTPPWMNQS